MSREIGPAALDPMTRLRAAHGVMRRKYRQVVRMKLAGSPRAATFRKVPGEPGCCRVEPIGARVTDRYQLQVSGVETKRVHDDVPAGAVSGEPGLPPGQGRNSRGGVVAGTPGLADRPLRARPRLVAAGLPHGVPAQLAAYPRCRLNRGAGELGEAEADLRDRDLLRDFPGGITTVRYMAGRVKPAAQARSCQDQLPAAVAMTEGDAPARLVPSLTLNHRQPP